MHLAVPHAAPTSQLRLSTYLCVWSYVKAEAPTGNWWVFSVLSLCSLGFGVADWDERSIV